MPPPHQRYTRRDAHGLDRRQAPIVRLHTYRLDVLSQNARIALRSMWPIDCLSLSGGRRWSCVGRQGRHSFARFWARSSSSLRSALCSRWKSVFEQYSRSSPLPPDLLPDLLPERSRQTVSPALATTPHRASEWSSSPWQKSGVTPRGARRPAGKARRLRIPAVFEGGATQPPGMHRPSNAARLLPRAASTTLSDRLIYSGI
jgi:hypothetical protein